MGFKEEWAQVSPQTKMMFIGGGGVALFFLYSSFKNRNNAAAQQAAQQDTSTGPQTAAVDPTGWMDQQTQNMQAMQQLIGGISDSIQQDQQANQDANNQNLQAMQQLIQQNQQATQQQLSALMSNMGTVPAYPTAPAPAAPPKASPAQPAPVKAALAPVPVKAAPAPTTSTYTVKPGDNLWNIAKNDVLPKGSSNSTIITTVNKIASANKLSNPNLILPGQKLIISVPLKQAPAPVKAAPAPVKAAPAPKTVTVTSGQNLWTIAKNNVLPKGSSNSAIQKEVNVLASANHISNANLIKVGQKITLR